MSHIKIDYDNETYTLEFNRRTVQQMEADGFVAADIATKPMTMLPLLFNGAFKMHHKYMKQEKIDEIYRSLPNKGDLVESLATLYSEPIQTLVDEPDEDSEKKGNWTLLR